jgi:hypothetical protein
MRHASELELTSPVAGGTGTQETPRLRRIWLTLEAPDIIEMKQVVLDRNAPGAAAFFQRVVVPRVRDAARRRGIPLDVVEKDEGDGHLSG